MHGPAAALTGMPAVVAGIRVLALLEATRITGVARNVLEFASLAAAGMAGGPIVATLGLIRRGPTLHGGADPLRQAAAARHLRCEFLLERYRYDRRVIAQLQQLVRAERPAIIETHHVK